MLNIYIPWFVASSRYKKDIKKRKKVFYNERINEFKIIKSNPKSENYIVNIVCYFAEKKSKRGKHQKKKKGNERNPK